MRTQKGFSLLELVVVIAILITITGVVTPYVLGMLDDGKVSKILQTYERVSQATINYQNDILHGNAALTKDDPLLIPLEKDATHDLYYRPTVSGVPDPARKGWDGPYLNHPLESKDNPFGGVVYVRNRTVMTWSADWNGWQVQGVSGGVVGSRLYGNGAFLTFSNVPLDIAEKIDAIVDRDVADQFGLTGPKSSSWSTIGKCLYEASSLSTGMTNSLYLYISDLDGK